MNGFTVRDWKPFQKNALRGFCTVETPGGVIFKEVGVFEKEGKRWIGMPSRPWKKADGTNGYVPLVEFKDWDTKNKFQAGALEAIDKLISGGGQ